MFNYATGPVEMAAVDRSAMLAGPTNSHAADGQQLVTDTLDALRAVLELPPEFDLLMLPGSIRQALYAVTYAVMSPGQRCLSIESGYWGGWIGDLVRSRVGQVERSSDAHSIRSGYDVVTAVHMETETGLMQPLGRLAELRRSGTLTVVDAACTVPLHTLDYDVADVVVLGSHKCLAGPPGIGIIAVRREVDFGGEWPVSAYRADAVARRSGTSVPAPLVTYPLEVVSALHSSVTALLAEPDFRARRVEGARHLRAGLIERRFDVLMDEGVSNTVTRVDLDESIDAEAFRSSLLDRGFFVIGNVGASSGGSVRVGTMSRPQIEAGNIDALLDAFEDARRDATASQLVGPQSVSSHD